jgi:hypothetical protein
MAQIARGPVAVLCHARANGLVTGENLKSGNYHGIKIAVALIWTRTFPQGVCTRGARGGLWPCRGEDPRRPGTLTSGKGDPLG